MNVNKRQLARNRPKTIPKILNGTIKRHPDGFGFFIPQDVEHPDVFIPANAMKTAMTSDKVSVIAEEERDGRFKGEIVGITERSQKRVAGSFAILNEKIGLIKDDGKGWGKDLKVKLEKSMNAKSGDLVVAEILTYPDSDEFTGVITSIIGDIEDALNDIKRVVISQNIPDVFSPQTLKEAETFKENPVESDFKNRKNLRHLNLITIDGATAKDFDDAVFVETKNNGFHLIVGIADVSHYVKPTTAIDKDAYERGTSVYFPNFVIPMLPEALSNGLCSLVPHVPRLALVADMQFDFTGQMVESVFYEAVIESKARVTYGQAQEIIDSPEGTSEVHQKFSHVKENILKCADLAKVLMAKRFKEGSLDLEVPETELMIDGSGEPIDIIKSERLFAHRLIEEMMLAANIAVAKFLAQKEMPALYRTHEPPDPLKIAMLEKFIHQFGSTANLSGDRIQKKLTRALQEFANQPQGQIIHILTLRSMSQAKYTLENIGHFGLGFDYYAHFTSPIRRYPDLIIHRLVKCALKIPGYRFIPEEDVSSAGTWLSACEQRSAKSERQIQAIKKARFMKKMIGQAFEGLISSVTKFGVFVLLREYNIDGLIRLDDLGPEKFQFDEENLKLVAPRSGLTFNLGDRLQVIVSSVDIENGQINFLIEGQEDNHTKKTSSHQSHKKNKSLGFKDKKSQASLIKTKKEPAYEKKSEELSTLGSSQLIKPKYASLSDYLDKMLSGKKNKSDDKSLSGKSSWNLKGAYKDDTKSKDNNKLQFGKVSKSGFKSKSSTEKKSDHERSANRKNSEERDTPSNDSGRFRKTRPQKSSRKNKSR